MLSNVNAAVRSSDRKRAEAETYGAVTANGRGYAAHQCWVGRATRRNRELVGRYAKIFAVAFPESSKQWLDALTRGSAPPTQRGLVWCDVAATRLDEWRKTGPR